MDDQKTNPSSSSPGWSTTSTMAYPSNILAVVNNQIKNIILRYPNLTTKSQSKPFKRNSKLSISKAKHSTGSPTTLAALRSSMAVELLDWDADFSVSAVEASAKKLSTLPSFSCSLPPSWVKSWERFREFDSIPYISPYLDPRGLVEGSKEMEKRNVGLVHELLSLTLWKKASIHPGIFYVSNKYQIYTILLREAYVGSQLEDKDPLVLVKEKFGELMQEALHEYNQRWRLLNEEKRRKKGIPLIRVDDVMGKRRRHEVSNDDGDKLGGLFDPEERERSYKIGYQLCPPCFQKAISYHIFLKMNWACLMKDLVLADTGHHPRRPSSLSPNTHTGNCLLTALQDA
ncbi:hypothetical protein VNO77_12783 [Canavalia gladiata]|uniref:PORR domain-containing protein n=1 Tax=Canavalia gladiata TaxID=3824 RepID=A0AAN9LWN0_CANGL